MTDSLVVGVVGGSGLYEIEGLTDVESIELGTPFGAPSDAYLRGRIGDRTAIFLPRHGRGHRLSPTEINSRANIWGFKELGASCLLSFSAVGSMREDVAPGDFMIVDQFFDRTRHRADTFFEGGVVAHVGFADPVCPVLRGVLLETARSHGLTVHDGGTYLNMEGPQFSTRAESRIYRGWGVDVIGMTNVQEARLAREAELCYSTVAMVTDYDCWHEAHEAVSVEAVIAQMSRNTGAARDVVRSAVPRVPAERPCGCGRALENAIMTAPERIPAEARQRLGILIERYLA